MWYNRFRKAQNAKTQRRPAVGALPVLFIFTRTAYSVLTSHSVQSLAAHLANLSELQIVTVLPEN